jgi:hypothetical protein
VKRSSQRTFYMHNLSVLCWVARESMPGLNLISSEGHSCFSCQTIHTCLMSSCQKRSTQKVHAIHEGGQIGPYPVAFGLVLVRQLSIITCGCDCHACVLLCVRTTQYVKIQGLLLPAGHNDCVCARLERAQTSLYHATYYPSLLCTATDLFPIRQHKTYAGC